MKQTPEEAFDEINALLEGIERKIKDKEISKPMNQKKNSHLHIMIETDLLNKVEKRAKSQNMSIAEFVRKKLRGNEQLDRIENKLDKILLSF